jgi:co-chaperonin GroES (HSP10)
MSRNPQRQPAERDNGRLFDYNSLDDAFPSIDPGLTPFGDRVLVQMRTPKKQSAGGIILPGETQETELWNTQVAKVISLGSTAFCNQDTLELWKEGHWCKPGEFVRVPKWGGDRWQVPLPNRSGEFALFVVFKDLDLIGAITGNPLDVVAYVY